MTAPSEVITDDIHKVALKARDAFDEERPSSKLVEALTEQVEGDGIADIREMIESLTTFADAWEAAQEAGSDWVGAEDRDDKREAREEFINALETLADAHDAITHDLTDAEQDALDNGHLAGLGAGDDPAAATLVAELLENLDLDSFEEALGTLAKMVLPLAEAQAAARL